DLSPGPRPQGAAPAAAASAAGASAAPMTKKEMYEVFVGPEKIHYYLPIFEGFDRGGNAAAWHTPAAFITQWWMLYRKMYLWGFLFYLILYWVVALTLTVAVGMISPALAGLGSFLAVVVSFVVMGLYSNKIYHSHVNSYIESSGRLGLGEQQRRDWLI